MRKIFLPLCLVAIIAFVACNTADNKVPQMAQDFCNCFKLMEDSLSDDTKAILKTAAESNDPDNAMVAAVEGLSEEKKMSVGMEMMSFQTVEDPDSEIAKCMKKIETKYKYDRTTDKKKFGDNLIKELESKKGCEVTAAIMKLGFKQEFK